MWFGSKNGLWRYDAYELKGWKHKPGDSTSLFNNQVLCIVDLIHESIEVRNICS